MGAAQHPADAEADDRCDNERGHRRDRDLVGGGLITGSRHADGPAIGATRLVCDIGRGFAGALADLIGLALT